ncbi:MAG: hypothetical protein K2X66_16965 [Cyanobacteria bacterium]|nr:hypothetical protein [Cyanobacteriota bacterium]
MGDGINQTSGYYPLNQINFSFAGNKSVDSVQQKLLPKETITSNFNSNTKSSTPNDLAPTGAINFVGGLSNVLQSLITR